MRKADCVDPEATDDALSVVNRTSVKLQLTNRRFDANYACVRQSPAARSANRRQILHIISRDPAPPPITYVKGSGGIFLDMTIHDWDMAALISGSEIERGLCPGRRHSRSRDCSGDIDTHVTLLRFANGLIGTIDNCRQAVYGYDQRVEVLGTKGAIQTENNYPNNSVPAAQQHPARPTAQLLHGALHGFLRQRDRRLCRCCG
ncbi:MAG: Gfo/Idh/MocA family oxidoreductase [Caldilineaceae bacterium]